MKYKHLNWFHKLFGLMFQIPRRRTAYCFNYAESKERPIHTLFCYFSLDVVWLNKGIVVDKKTIRPFSFYVAHEGEADCIVEAKSGEFHFIKKGKGMLGAYKNG